MAAPTHPGGALKKITERIDAITRIPEAFRQAQVPAPKSVKIELSPRCNYRCDFCALRTRAKQPTQDMDFTLFQRITREMREYGVEEIGCFYLGESFIAPQLLAKAIAYLKRELGFPYVFLTSNASLATPQAVKACMEAGLDSLKWSVNAADTEQFARIMGVKTSLFSKALAHIKAARAVRDASGYATGLYASSIRYDGQQLDRMEALLDQHIRPYVDEHYWLPLYSMAMRSPEIERKLGYRPQHGNSGRFDVATGMPTRDPLPCWAVFSEGHVRSDGHMSACCFGSDDKFDVGDLNTQSFPEAWNGPAMQRIREAQMRTETEGPAALAGTFCESCVAYSPPETAVVRWI
jgi:MoaA/NifB/PqqE/SkfB family radical SAM enzyme